MGAELLDRWAFSPIDRSLPILSSATLLKVGVFESRNFCHSIKRFFLFGERLPSQEFSATRLFGVILFFPTPSHPYPSHLELPSILLWKEYIKRNSPLWRHTNGSRRVLYIDSWWAQESTCEKRKPLGLAGGWAAISYLYTSMMAGSVVKVTLSRTLFADSLASTRNFSLKTYEKSGHAFKGGFEIGWGTKRREKSNSDSSPKNYFRNFRLVLEK